MTAALQLLLLLTFNWIKADAFVVVESSPRRILKQLPHQPTIVDAKRMMVRTTTASTTTTQLFDGLLGETDIRYGEESRKFRRTIYTHDDWVKHRSHRRFFRNIYTSCTSGIYRNIATEVLVVTCIATLVVVWNSIIVGGFTDFVGQHHPPIFHNLPKWVPILQLPLTPFTLASSSLGLLLGKHYFFGEDIKYFFALSQRF